MGSMIRVGSIVIRVDDLARQTRVLDRSARLRASRGRRATISRCSARGTASGRTSRSTGSARRCRCRRGSISTCTPRTRPARSGASSRWAPPRCTGTSDRRTRTTSSWRILRATASASSTPAERRHPRPGFARPPRYRMTASGQPPATQASISPRNLAHPDEIEEHGAERHRDGPGVETDEGDPGCRIWVVNHTALRPRSMARRVPYQR